MKQEEYLEKLHVEILSIVSEIVRICRKKGLKYYLVEGSLLGAVRHNGFIPWDDDVDIAMPRKDFDCFIECCSKELNGEFYLDWITTNSRYYHIFAKVCKKGTEFTERIGKTRSVSHGIFVDLFPLDSSTGCTVDTERKKSIIDLCNRVLSAKYYMEETRILKKLVLSVVPSVIIKAYMLHILRKHPNREYNYYTNYGSAYPIQKETFLKEEYGEGVLVRFEKMDVIIPTMYKKMLSKIYGDNYMELPPLEKRITHHPLSIMFSDGTRDLFDNK